MPCFVFEILPSFATAYEHNNDDQEHKNRSSTHSRNDVRLCATAA